MKMQICAISKSTGTQNTKGTWYQIRKVRTKHMPTVPVGKVNNVGKIVCDQDGLKKLCLETFIWRLRDRPLRPDLVDIQEAKEKLFEAMLKICMKNRSKPWNLEQLENVLSSLKKDKCCDPKGLLNELFSTNVAELDLRRALRYSLHFILAMSLKF